MPVPIQLHISNKYVDIQSSGHYPFLECLCHFLANTLNALIQTIRK